MKIVKIKKNTRSSIIEHFLILPPEPFTDNIVDEFVEEWCESDTGGSYYGYSFSWDYVKDDILKKDILEDKIDQIEDNIKSLNLRKSEILNYLFEDDDYDD